MSLLTIRARSEPGTGITVTVQAWPLLDCRIHFTEPIPAPADCIRAGAEHAVRRLSRRWTDLMIPGRNR